MRGITALHDNMFVVASLANLNGKRWQVRVAGANIPQLPLIQSVSLLSPLSLVGQEPLKRACVSKGYARAYLSSTLDSINLDYEHLESKTGRYRGALVRVGERVLVRMREHWDLLGCLPTLSRPRSTVLSS